jgi:hypothetical protein
MSLAVNLEAPKDINFEDGNCAVCRNIGKLSIFHTAYSQKPKSYISISVYDPHVHITTWTLQGNSTAVKSWQDTKMESL